MRWLGRVPYSEALELQRGFHRGSDSHLLLVEHDHTFTYGPHANLAEHLRCTPEDVGAELIAVDRGGDITYHGPGQLTGYPILSLAAGAGPLRHVLSVEEVLINALRDLGASDPGRSAVIRVYGSIFIGESAQNCGYWCPVARSERCTASLSMSPPTWPTCVNTSLRAAS